MSTFSCHTGRYNSTVDDIIVFKVDPDGDDDATIKTESNYPGSISGQTIQSELTHATRPLSQYGVSTHRAPSQLSRKALSTFSTPPGSSSSTISTASVPQAASTIAVNENHDDDNYNILLRRKNDKAVHPSPISTIQTGTFFIYSNNSNIYYNLQFPIVYSKYTLDPDQMMGQHRNKNGMNSSRNFTEQKTSLTEYHKAIHDVF